MFYMQPSYVISNEFLVNISFYSNESAFARHLPFCFLFLVLCQWIHYCYEDCVRANHRQSVFHIIRNEADFLQEKEQHLRQNSF